MIWQPAPAVPPQADCCDCLQPYLSQAAALDERPLLAPGFETTIVPPDDVDPWWNVHVVQPLNGEGQVLHLSIDNVVLGALEHSPRIMALSIDPALRHTLVAEEQSAFDWRTFLESTYDDTSDPVGNELTTGGSPRFRDNNWQAAAGLRRRTDRGGEFEVAQRIGYQDNNSRFFTPTQQGSARFELSYSQPLLRGSGQAYNTSRIVLATIDHHIAGDEVARQLQDHLFETSEAYWSLYRARAVLLQKRRLYERGRALLDVLSGRRNMDAVERQILRARAAVAMRESQLVRAEAEVRNADARLRLLVGDPQLAVERVELAPCEAPETQPLELSMQSALETALRNRPDIARAIRAMNAASVRAGLAKKDVLPKLDLVLSTYLAGLEGRSDIASAWGNQVDQGEPGYSIGLFFEVPLGNRAARARLDRRQLEVTRAFHEFHDVVQSGMTEVEVAVREAQTAHAEITGRLQSVLASEAEAHYLHDRWRHLPGEDRSTPLLLEDLLAAQERVAQEELSLADAQVNYVLAVAALKRAMGTLLVYSDEQPQEPQTFDTGSAPPLPSP